MLRWCLSTVRTAGASDKRPFVRWGSFWAARNASQPTVEQRLDEVERVADLSDSPECGQTRDLVRSAAIARISTSATTACVTTSTIASRTATDDARARADASPETLGDKTDHHSLNGDCDRSTNERGDYSSMPATCDEEASRSGKEEQPDVREALETLQTFLSSSDLQSLGIQTPSARLLRTRYYSVKKRSQLAQVTDTNFSSLISLFGSLSIPNARAEIGRHKYGHRLTLHMNEPSFRDHWPFVLQILKDKRSLGRKLSDSDHYWLMRARLAELSGSAPLETSLGRVRAAYFHVRRHSSSPDVHLPYMESLLSLDEVRYVDEAFCEFSTLVASLDYWHPQYVSFLWRLVLRHGSNISSGLKIRLLHVLRDRLTAICRIQEQFEESGNHDVLWRLPDIISRMTNCIFHISASKGPSKSHARFSSWCINFATVAFDANPSNVSICWNNLLLFALANAPAESLDAATRPLSHANDRLDSVGENYFRTVYILRVLEETFTGMTGPIADDMREDLKNVLTTLWGAWMAYVRSGVVPPPSVVTGAVLTSFLRLSSIAADIQLAAACVQYVSSTDLLSTEGRLGKDFHMSVVAHMFASVIRGASRWEDLFQLFGDLVYAPGFQSALASGLVLRLCDHDVGLAHRFVFIAPRAGISISAEAMANIGLAVCRQEPFELALTYLRDKRLSERQLEPLLRVLLIRIYREQSRLLPKHILASVADVLKSVVPASVSRGQVLPEVLYILLLMCRSGLSRHAMRLFDILYGERRSEFSRPFVSHLLKALLRHKQYSLACRLFSRLVSAQPSKWLVLYPTMMASLTKGGAMRLARRMDKQIETVLASGSNSIQKTFVNRVRSLAATRLSNKSHSPSLSNVRYAMIRHVQAGQVRAAYWLFEATRTKFDARARTDLGNIILHGDLTGPARKPNAGSVVKIISSLSRLTNLYQFIPDRVTTNILMKVLLQWRTQVDSARLQVIFDHIIRLGYPTGEPESKAPPDVPFGTRPSAHLKGLHLPPKDSRMSFRRHVRPLYLMFAHSFYVRGDVYSARTVLRILRKVHGRWLRRVEATDRARREGRMKARRQREK